VKKKKWYEELFTNYANQYDKEPFTQGTIQEVDFIEKEISYDKSKKILDIGCGTGRHAIELAKRGYKVTGIDLSENLLNKAKEKAKKENTKVTFVKKDARNFSFPEKFDVVIMICEGAFSLMETDDMNYKILKNAEKALKPGGKFIFTTLNVLFPLFHSVKDFYNKNEGSVHTESLNFNLLTFREHSTIEITDDSGNKKTLKTNERYYAPPEIKWYLKNLGFKNIEIFGCTVGQFSREEKLTPDHFEILVISEK